MNCEYEIIKKLNDTTFFAIKDYKIYIAKKIHIDETPIYKALMGVENPNLAKIFTLTTIDSDFFAIEEYINGTTLKELVEINPLSHEQIKKITLDICNGLRSLHNLGIVHRDITPSNIMIDNMGNAKIIDYGISRFIKANQVVDTQILGTPGFAPPEQYGFNQTNSASDVYSVGILINYMATGKLPNEKKAIGFWGQIVTKATEIDSVNRYSDIISLENAINKRKAISFMHNIIGFRSGKVSHIILSTIYYIIFAIFVISLIATSKGVYDAVCTVLAFLFLFLMPIPVIFDYKNWTQKFKIIKRISNGKSTTAKILGTAFCIIVGFAFILICPT